MTKEDHQMLQLLALMQITCERTDDLIQSKTYAGLFRFQLKRTANNYVKECDKILNQISTDGRDSVNEQLFAINKKVSDMLDNLEL